jgi:hypothetical protein
MIKQFCLSFIVFIFSTTVFANVTCPTPAQIHSHLLQGWHAYTNDNGTDLTPEELTEFENTIGRFTYTAWLEYAPEGEAHCYYFNQTGDYAIAYLAKPNLIPAANSRFWHDENGHPTCRAGVMHCFYA